MNMSPLGEVILWVNRPHIAKQMGILLLTSVFPIILGENVIFLPNNIGERINDMTMTVSEIYVWTLSKTQSLYH